LFAIASFVRRRPCSTPATVRQDRDTSAAQGRADHTPGPYKSESTPLR
jgi:hypothetical protein